MKRKIIQLSETIRKDSWFFLSAFIFCSIVGAFSFIYEDFQRFLNLKIYDSSLQGTVSVFVILFSIFVAVTIFISWFYGGRTAFMLSTLTWNAEILLYNFYSGKWEYSIEHINLLLFFYIYVKDIPSPADLKARHLVRIEKENQQLEKFRLIFNKTIDDFREFSSDQKQSLQHLEFSYTDMLSTILKNEEHDLKNKLSLAGMENIEKEIYNLIIVPFRDKMLAHLNHLPELIDIRCTEYQIQSVIIEIEKLINEIQAKNKSVKISILSSEDIARSNDNTFVNLQRINSIVFNLIANSIVSINKKKDLCREKREPFSGKIDINISIVKMENQNYWMLSIQDNGEGFPIEVLDKIYKEPIKSTKSLSKERLGEGTIYIGFFTQYMQGTIEATNIGSDKLPIGANTIIKIPLILKKENNND